VEVQLTVDQQAKLAQLAASQGRDQSALVQDAVERLLAHEAWFLDEVEKGLLQADRGEFVDHTEVRDWIRSRYPGRC
jgi:RHH-type transcriptional regulator, rel operon repressor / antitoxin RelB